MTAAIIKAAVIKAAILAAGHGERLRPAGITGPKPLVEVAGVPLIEHTLRTIRATGVRQVVCIINDESTAVADYCRQHVTDLSVQFVQRTTPSSMESLFTLAPTLTDEAFFLLTVDAIVDPAAARRFMTAAVARTDADGVLAVNTFIEDEKPLHVVAGSDGRISAIGAGAAASSLITAGFYVFRPAIFAEIDAARQAGFTALRQFLGHLVTRGYRLYAESVPKCVDVDRLEDIAVAEAFVRSGYTS